ncbi:SRPBCC family protein [Candidatus Dojkabacteria bacterium]|uniref:SRPBCC family protein n=1 Tax=Candidatus Dojkabacteria bacterium TaxID=2099670 RepID=A0A955L2U7_9BACT|nr:SRPBCC family protein [Candidatus Dojkabacteria bacterium]
MINTNSTLYSKSSLLINSPLSHVWSVQTNIKQWPKWQKNITNVQALDNVSKGSTFKWKASGLAITSKVEEFKEERVIGWSGKSIGMTANHWWYFESEGNSTRVTTEESLNGWLAQIFKIVMPGFLDKSLKDALEKLKVESERIHK